MRNPFSSMLHIGVAPSGITLRGKPAAKPLAELRLDNSSHPDTLAAAVGAVLADAGCARRAATIVLADELVRIWHVTPPAGSTRLADLEGAAALRFQSLYGDSAAAWAVSAGWDATAPFLAAAIPRTLLTQLELVCATHRITLVDIVPQFIAAFNQWRRVLKAGAWYGNVQDQVLTLAAIEGGSIRAVRASAVGAGADAAWLDMHVAREALRLNLPVPAQLCLSGQAPPAWRSASVSLLDAGGSA